MPCKVAIVGRPNVGKSTLFNRLVGRKLALVDDTPGVTRDRREGDATLGDLAFTIVDTAGYEDATDNSLEARMRQQTEAAIADANVCLFMIDVRAGVTPMDDHFAQLLRRSGKPVIVLANKAEGRAEVGAYDAYSLGLGDPVAISAEHGDGLGSLYDALQPFVDKVDEDHKALLLLEEDLSGDYLDEDDDGSDPERPMKIAVIGRPNAGKSTLINTLLGEERLLTGPEAGITRDSIAIDWVWQDRRLRLFDTAGIRKKARVNEKLEKLSVADALRAIRFAEVVIMTIDVTIPFEKQDLQLADLVVREGRSLVIALNKWDLVENRQETLADLTEKCERLLPQIRGVQMVPISGLTGHNLERLLKAVTETYAVWNRRLSTSRLNRWFDDITQYHPPPAVAGRRMKLRYITQAKARPPTFILFCTRAEAMPEAYKRYLLNAIREDFELPGTPLRLILREGKNPYADQK
ncbi:MAG: ribosome biogenesis GTPase Der [Rhizobiales bacterium]|nr:ribosome biogenesis GTPase Der [Hyphomicrobiales bacterium]